MSEVDSASSFKRLIDVGLALSAEKDINHLMERILIEAKDLVNADGGTLYVRSDEDELHYEIMRNDSMGTASGGTTGVPITIPPVPLFLDGNENHANVVTHSALTGLTINVTDVYESDEFDFSGPKNFDQNFGYRTKSVLAVPMKNHQEVTIGVLQLINCQDTDTGEAIPFHVEDLPLIEALSSQAAVALENQQLLDAQKRLLDSFIELMASAVDAKSPYTGGHCVRVPELTEMLAAAACGQTEGPFADFELSDDEEYELHIAAWLHDCGKVTTPEYVVDKATKLETITDRIHEVRMRFEVVKLEAIVEYQQALLERKGDPHELKEELDRRLEQLDDDYAFIAQCNVGGEFMEAHSIERVKQIAEMKWTRTLSDRIGISGEELGRKTTMPEPALPVRESLLADRDDHVFAHDQQNAAADPNNAYGFRIDVPSVKYNRGEIYNLCIQKGTLTEEERFKINDHIVQTIVMLEQLPFPKHLAKVPEFAGGHHEKMDGTGYPKCIEGATMSVPARIMAIADIFEALTAADRPYKSPKTLSEAIRIMSFMVKDAHIDPDLFQLFLASGVYQEYADKYLDPSQIDEVDISQYLS